VGGVEEISWQEVGSLIFLIFLLFLAKLNLVPLVLFPFLLIPPSKFTHKRTYPFLLAVTVLLLLVEVAGWNIIASTHIDALLSNGADPTAQVLYLLGHPLTFLLTVIRDFLTNGWTYFQGWINGYGYYYWTPPQIVSFLFLLSLGSVLLADSTPEQANRKFRIVLILMFVASYLATVVSLYVSFTPVSSDQVLGVQGRYFIPLALLLFLTLSSFSWRRKIPTPSTRWVTLFLSLTLSLNILGIYLSFHVPCGTTFYQTGLCYRPLFRDFPSEVRPSLPISKETALIQEFQVTCNGFAELRVLLAPSVPGDQGSTHFVLQDPVSGQTLVDTSLANDQIATEDWYPLHFDPDWHSAGKQYILTASGTNTLSDQGLRFIYTPQSEFDLGNLHENGQLLQEDMVLQYGCATGLRKLWLTGKP